MKFRYLLLLALSIQGQALPPLKDLKIEYKKQVEAQRLADLADDAKALPACIAYIDKEIDEDIKLGLSEAIIQFQHPDCPCRKANEKAVIDHYRALGYRVTTNFYLMISGWAPEDK